jgi:hypothetical protein
MILCYHIGKRSARDYAEKRHKSQQETLAQGGASIFST